MGTAHAASTPEAAHPLSSAPHPLRIWQRPPSELASVYSIELWLLLAALLYGAVYLHGRRHNAAIARGVLSTAFCAAEARRYSVGNALAPASGPHITSVAGVVSATASASASASAGSAAAAPPVLSWVADSPHSFSACCSGHPHAAAVTLELSLRRRQDLLAPLLAAAGLAPKRDVLTVTVALPPAPHPAALPPRALAIVRRGDRAALARAQSDIASRPESQPAEGQGAKAVPAAGAGPLLAPAAGAGAGAGAQQQKQQQQKLPLYELWVPSDESAAAVAEAAALVGAPVPAGASGAAAAAAAAASAALAMLLPGQKDPADNDVFSPGARTAIELLELTVAPAPLRPPPPLMWRSAATGAVTAPPPGAGPAATGVVRAVFRLPAAATAALAAAAAAAVRQPAAASAALAAATAASAGAATALRAAVGGALDFAEAARQCGVSAAVTAARAQQKAERGAAAARAAAAAERSLREKEVAEARAMARRRATLAGCR
jgi:hypothetical protein